MIAKILASRLELVTLLAVATGCSMSGHASPSDAQPRTATVSVVPEAVNVLPEGTVTFAATVAGVANPGVSWSVAETGGGTVDAGGRYVAPASTGTFHVVATALADSAATATATVTVALPVRVGINLGWISDWDPNQIFADMIKQGRAWGAVGSPSNGSTLVPVDASGWPTTDTEVIVLMDRPEGGYGGTYALSFEANGAAAAARVAGEAVSLTRTGEAPPYRYTGNATVASTSTGFTVAFTNTEGGVRDARLLRPGHGPTEVFNQGFLARLGTFGLLRPMETFGPGTTWGEAFLPQTVGVMGNADTTWASRALPARSCLTLTGPAWEHLVLLANQVQQDLWINIPYHATDEYITSLAKLMRYGSDGVDPYDGPQMNPAFPPLDPSLKLYVEYGNELWNSAYGFPNTQENEAAAVAETGASDTLHLGASSTGSGDTGRSWRRIGALAVRASVLFRRVFGAGEMMTRVRPVAATQMDRSAVTQEILDYISRTWGASTSYTEVTTTASMGGTVFSGAELGNPVSHYVWAIAVAPYVGYAAADRNPATLDAAFGSLNQMLSGSGNSWGENIFEMIDFAASAAQGAGLKLVTYEGGQDLRASDAFAAAAQTDPRMRTLMLDLMHHVYGLGAAADVFTYFTLAGDGYYGLAPDLSADDSQKWQAVKAIASGL